MKEAFFIGTIREPPPDCFPGGARVVKSQPANARDMRPELGFSLWVGKILWRKAWQPALVFSSWRNPMDRGAWLATVHGVAESDMTRAT